MRARGTAAYSLPRTRLRSPANVAKLVLGLRGVARHERSDLIHASENTALLYASLAGRLAGIPVVWHIHSPLRPRGRTERAVERVLRALPPAHVVFTSDGARRRSVAFPDVPWSVITPGVDLAECAGGDAARGRRAFGIPDDARLVSMFARIEPMKGPVDFVRCLGHLAATRPDVYGVMCGPPDRGSPYWARIQSLVRELHLEERLVIPGDVRPPLSSTTSWPPPTSWCTPRTPSPSAWPCSKPWRGGRRWWRRTPTAPVS